MEGIPEPWSSLIDLIVGPGGAIIVLAVVAFFLWKLFREEQMENRTNFSTLSLQAKALEEVTAEMKEWREAFVQMVRRGGKA